MASVRRNRCARWGRDPRVARLETLEERRVLAVTLADINFVDLPASKYQYIALEADDDTDATVTFEATSSDPTVEVDIVSGGRTIRFNISGENADGQAFTGDIFLRMFEDAAPMATARLIELAADGDYDNTIFHRIIDNFVVQGGDDNGDGVGGIGDQFDDEFDARYTFNSLGLAALANSGDDVNQSQFFIVDTDLSLPQLPQNLNFNHTVVGLLTGGFDIFEQMIETPVQSGSNRPLTDVVINSAEVLDSDPERGVLRVFAPEGFDGSTDITVTATGGNNEMDSETFTLDVVADTRNDRPFLDMVPDRTVLEDNSITFSVPATDLEGDELTFVVRDPLTQQPPEDVSVSITVTPSSIDGAAFAEALADAGVVFYGRSDCQFCDEQKELFGEDVFDEGNTTPYVECLNEDGTTNQVCIDENVSSFPTWEFPDGTRLEGVQSLEVLAQRSGVALNVTPASASVTLTPDADFNGTIDLEIGVRDQANAELDTEEFTLNVVAVNDEPTSEDQEVFTDEETAVDITLVGEDGDDDADQTLTFEIVDQPQDGSLINFDASAGTVTYTPADGFVGVDSFTYRVLDDGGTANDGDDASAIATVTITVGGADAPVNLDLSAATDDGLFDDDNYFHTPSVTLTAEAEAGATVEFFVNGGPDGIAATEVSPGVFEVTLGREDIPVGVSEVTAIATVTTDDGDLASPASAPLEMTYAPVLNDVYVVPGEFDSDQTLFFDFVSRNAAFNNEIGFFPVDGLDGSVNGVRPGEDGYLAAAMANRTIVFQSGEGTGASNAIDVQGGDRIVFYLVADGTSDDVVANNPENRRGETHVFFSLDAANPDDTKHANLVGDATTGIAMMQWEDKWGGGDLDYNDAFIAVSPQAVIPTEVAEAIGIPAGAGRDVDTRFTLGETEAGNGASDDPASTVGGEFGVFLVDDDIGTVDGVSSTSDEYYETLLNSAGRELLFSSGTQVGSSQNLALPGGRMFGVYYIIGGDRASFLANNPTNDSAQRPIMVTTFDVSNPDNIEHFRWTGGETAESSVNTEPGTVDYDLHVMDEIFGSETDFSDYLLEIEFLG